MDWQGMAHSLSGMAIQKRSAIPEHCEVLIHSECDELIHIHCELLFTFILNEHFTVLNSGMAIQKELSSSHSLSGMALHGSFTFTVNEHFTFTQ